MAKSNWLLPTLRGVSIFFLVLLILMLGTIYEIEIFNIFSVFGLVGQLRDILSFLLYIAIYFILYWLAMGVGTIFSLFGSAYFNGNFFLNLVNEIIYNVIGGWFYLPDPETGEAMIAPTVPEALVGAQAVYGEISADIYVVVLQVLVAIMFFYALRASITNNPTDSITTVTLINLVIIIPLFFSQLSSVISIFVPGDIAFLSNITGHNLLLESIFVDISIMNFWQFITSNIFLVALFMFLYLELVFQVSYIDKVTAPSIEREERLSRQIEVMKVESMKAITRIKAVEEKKREKKLLQQASMTQEDMEAEKEGKKRLSLRTMMSEKGQAGFSFVSELIEKKKLEKEEERMMEAMKDTRKVSNYLEKLFSQDPEAKNTLTAKTSAPSSTRLIVSTFVSLGSRIFIIILLTWACVHPYAIFTLLFSPDSIVNSVELQTYEGVLSVLIPFLLVIPFISTIIKISKHAKLEEMLKLEEIRRSGLSEEELKLLQEKRAKAAAKETQFSRDQDAAADQARKAVQNAPPGQNP